MSKSKPNSKNSKSRQPDNFEHPFPHLYLQEGRPEFCAYISTEGKNGSQGRFREEEFLGGWVEKCWNQGVLEKFHVTRINEG